MKKVIALLLAMMLVFGLVACAADTDTTSDSQTDTTTDTTAEIEDTTDDTAAEDTAEDTSAEDASAEEPKSVGFVTFGLGGDFFQSLADTFVAKFTEAGWDAQYVDGAYDPTTQIEACENFIAMGVDVLVCWSVAPEAMDAVIASAQEKGIKFVAFVAETSAYDALMVSDDADLAAYAAKLAAKWIDETYADAEDHSVPVAVFSCRTAETGVVQADVLVQIEQYSTKAKFVTEIECADEDMPTGQTAAETLYTSNPEIKVFLTAHNGLATGINNYYTSISSPVTDYSDMGIFCINGDAATGELIQASMNNESPMRGMVLTGSVDDTANEMLYVCNGIMDGTLEIGHTQKAGTMFVYADTVEEYLSTGTVTSVTNADFD